MQPSSLHAAADDARTYTFVSQRQVGHIDHVNILLEASGDVLTKSGSGEKPERQEIGLTCRRDYDEKTLQMPTDDGEDAAGRSLLPRGLGHAQERQRSCRTPP